MSKRALIVEDESDISELIALHLRDLCSEVAQAATGTYGLELALQGGWSLVVLDLRLPGVDGLEICRQMRRAGDHTPILMLTAKSGELDRVLGLETGADDYLTKPFSVLELMARVRALFRRVDAFAEDAEHGVAPLQAGDITIDPEQRTVAVAGKPVELTPKEFDLLSYFVNHPGRVFRRSQLLDNIWGYGHDGYEHTVNSHINRLRAKIESDPTNPRYIVTVWGVGYKLGPAAEMVA